MSFQYIGNIIGALKLIVKSRSTSQEKAQSIEKIIQDDFFQLVIHGMDTHKEKMTRKILLTAMKMKMWRTVFSLVKLKHQL